MNPDEALHLLRQLGLILEVYDGRLNVGPANLLDNDVRWLIRKHRDAIIAELQNNAPRWAWLVRLEGYALETYHYPDAIHVDVMRKYPDALSVTPLPKCLWPHDAANTVNQICEAVAAAKIITCQT